MEPSGRNRWQPAAMGEPRKRLGQAKTVRADLVDELASR
jgi:hypothetical protein